MSGVDPQRAIEERASDWLLRRQAGLSPAEEGALAGWLAESPQHAAAFQQVETLWSAFDRADSSGGTKTILAQLEVRARRRSSRRRAWLAGSAAAAAVLLGALWHSSWPAVPVELLSVEAPAQLTLQKLPDGSIVELNRGAVVQVRFEPSLRQVLLERGEAHFTVAKDAVRPFVVQAAGVQVRAVGTAFTVDLRAAAVEVVVSEGKVVVAKHDPRDHSGGAAPAIPDVPPVLEAGRRVVVPLGHERGAPEVAILDDAAIAARLSWRKPRVEFANTTLADAVAVMNRHNRLQIAVGDAAVARLRISGSFGADNPEGFVRIVEATFDLLAEPRGDGAVILRSRP